MARKAPQRIPIKYVLAVSLAVNAALGGVLVAWSVESGHRPKEFRIEATMERVAAGLPKADGEKLMAVVHANEEELLARRTVLHAAQDAVRAAIAAEPFDPAVLTQAFEHSRAARQAMGEAVENIIVSAAPTMSAEGRKRLSDWRKYR
ncbi:MAG: periplasmic heavy metal sensor [Alphaproteobacteria bacterium]